MALLPGLGGLPRTFWILWVGTLINRIGSFAVTFLALYFRDERALSVERTGLLMSIYGAGSMVAGLTGGALADRIGRKPTMLISLTLGPLALVLLSIARDPAWVAFLVLISAGFGEMYRPAMHAAVADLTPPADRARAFGFVYWAANLGFAIAPVIAGWISSVRFEAVFWADAATSMLYAALIAARVPETRPPPAAAKDETGTLAPGSPGRGGPFRDGVFMVFVGISLLVAMLFQQSMSTLPMDMRDHGISRERFGTIIALNGLLIVFLQPSASMVVGRYRRSRVLAFGTVLTAIGFGINAFASTSPLGAPALYCLGVVVWTLGEIAIMPVAPTVVSDLAPAHQRGSYQGVFHLSWGVAALASPTLGALVLGRFGAPALWAATAAVGMFAAWAHLASAPARKRKLEQIRASDRAR